MKDEKKTRAQLIAELQNLRKKCDSASHLSAGLQAGTDVFRSIVENAKDAIISINTDGCIVFLNRKAEEMCGYTAAEVMGKPSSYLMPEGRKDLEKKALDRHSQNVANGYLNSLNDGVLLRKNGTLLPVEVSYYGYHLNGEYFMTAILRDISDRKKIEKALEEARDFYARLFDTSMEGLVVSDSQGYITMVNNKAAEMLAYTKKDLIGKHFGNLGLTLTDEQEKAKKIIEEFLIHGELSGVERIWKRRDGSSIYVEMNIYQIKDTAGNIVGAMSSFRDIGLRKQADMALRASEERYRRIFENAFVAILEEDISPVMSVFNDLKPAGVRDIRTYLKEHPEFLRRVLSMITIIDANEAALRLFGARNKEELASSTDKIWREESLAASSEALIAFAEGKPFFQIESIHHTLQGVQKNVILQINFLIKQRDSNRVMVCLVDITPLKAAEKELFSYQQQLRALTNQLSNKEEDEKRKMGMYLHDRIGQSLSILKMKLEMMGAALRGGDDGEKFGEILELIEKTIHDTRVLSYELSPVILHELGLEAALGWLAEQIQKQYNLAVAFTTDNKAEPLDNDLKIILYRAVSELLNNVVKHAWAQRVAVSIKLRNGQVQITVEDDGVGFDPALLEGIAATERGFGLFSIKERLHYLGGTIQIKSAPYKGTRITLLAPFK
jgi:PAS domain S-box-containing protein